MYKFTSINQEYPLSTLDENQVDKISHHEIITIRRCT